MKPRTSPLSRKETLSLLFENYLSRNIDNLEKRVNELGWPDSSLEVLEKRGWIVRLKNTSKVHFERVNREPKNKKDANHTIRYRANQASRLQGPDKEES